MQPKCALFTGSEQQCRQYPVKSTVGAIIRIIKHSFGLVCAYSLIGLVVKVSASRAEDPGFERHLCQDFSGVESYQ